MLANWLENFSFLGGAPAAYTLVAAAVVLALSADWRVVLSALLVQYVALTVLLGEIFAPGLAFSKMVVGLFVCLIFYVTVRQLGVYGVAALNSDALRIRPWRVAVAVLGVGVAWLAAGQTAAAAVYYPFALFALGILGVFRFVSTTTPLLIGVGLLMILSGFELFYLPRNPSVFLLGLFACGHLITVTVVAYLAQLQALSRPASTAR